MKFNVLVQLSHLSDHESAGMHWLRTLNLLALSSDQVNQDVGLVKLGNLYFSKLIVMVSQA